MGRGPCCPKEGMNKGAWTAIEDQILKDYVKVHGEGKWGSIPKRVGLKRSGKSCRLRWLNYLRPNIKRGNITPDEDDLIIRLHNLLGNRWSIIAGRLPGRTDNEIKNHWNTNLSKRAKGIKQPITSNTKMVVSTISTTSKPAPATLSVLQKKSHEVSSTSAVVTSQVHQLPNHYQYFSLGDNVETVEPRIPNPLKNVGIELSVLSNEEGRSSKLMGDYGLGDINISELPGSDFTNETRYSAQALFVPEEYWSTTDEILEDKVDEDFGTFGFFEGII